MLRWIGIGTVWFVATIVVNIVLAIALVLFGVINTPEVDSQGNSSQAFGAPGWTFVVSGVAVALLMRFVMERRSSQTD